MTTRMRTKTKKTVTVKLRAALIITAAALLVSLFLPRALSLPPQSSDHKKDYALIFGTVWDKDAHPAYGVRVKIRRADHKKAQWELVSDHRGEFAQRVPVGAADYIIWAEIKHPKGAKPVETKVHIENNERVDAALHLTE